VVRTRGPAAAPDAAGSTTGVGVSADGAPESADGTPADSAKAPATNQARAAVAPHTFSDAAAVGAPSRRQGQPVRIGFGPHTPPRVASLGVGNTANCGKHYLPPEQPLPMGQPQALCSETGLADSCQLPKARQSTFARDGHRNQARSGV